MIRMIFGLAGSLCAFADARVNAAANKVKVI